METASDAESADAKTSNASSHSGEGPQGAVSSPSVAAMGGGASGTNDAGGNSGGESDQNDHSSGGGSSDRGPVSQASGPNSGGQDIGQQSSSERDNSQKTSGQQNDGGPTSPDVSQGPAANRETAAAEQETQAGVSPPLDSPAPSRAPLSGSNAGNSGPSGPAGTTFSSGREVRSVVLAQGGTEATSAVHALRTVLESKSPARGPIQAASPGHWPAAVGRLEIVPPSTLALEIVGRILPQLGGLAVIPRLVPLNALNGFTDAIAGFAHESAELGMMLAVTHSHQFAWTVTSVVLAADTVLIGCWCAARRRKRGPVERGRFPFSLRRIRS